MSNIASLQQHTPLSPAGSPQPQVPGSPLQPGQDGIAPAGGPVRRKASGRANTAERRATHNAVERQRRETLNSRFLDLAGLLPNLASVRRPSKSAIVNSSIVLIHAQRRARAVAGRELRTLKSEADLLRREVNEWRDRAQLPRVEEGPRSADFAALMTLEEEEEMGEDERRAYELRDAPGDEDDDGDYADDAAAQQQQQQAHFHAVPSQMHHHHHHQATMMAHPRMAIHTTFEQHQAAPLYDAPLSAISMHSAPDALYAPANQAPAYQPQQMFTPPSSSHGAPPVPTTAPISIPANTQSFLRQHTAPAYAPQHQLFQHALSVAAPAHHHHSDDDSSSVGSAHSERASPPTFAAGFEHLVPHQLAAGMGAREMQAQAQGFAWPAHAQFKPVQVGGAFPLGNGLIM